MKIKYEKINVLEAEKNSLNIMAEKYNINYYEADIIIQDNMDMEYNIANQLFNYILEKAIENLDISYEAKEYLMSKIYINYSVSCLDIMPEEVDGIDILSEEEKEKIKNFLYL